MSRDIDAIGNGLMEVEQAVESIACCTARHIIASGIAAVANKDPGDVDTAAAWAVEFGVVPHPARVGHAVDFIGYVDRRVQRQSGNVRLPAICAGWMYSSLTAIFPIRSAGDRTSTCLNSSH